MAHVTPLHKKPSLDRNSIKSYRPVSNLSFISKLIEKVVANQLNEFISHEGLLNVNQSAYKSSHSTETALLKIQNDIAFSVDSGKAVALTLLDLSAAFDTIDHSLLYDCLHDWFGLDGTVLLWVISYLSNRKQKIKIGYSFSEAVILPFGVPRGNISPSVEVKNLGVIFDSDNSFDNHVAKICRACYYHLRDLQRIRKFLSDETAILLANAMVSSHLDYCNSLLYGVSKSNIAKLQRVQNALCRIIFRLDKMSHVTPFLKNSTGFQFNIVSFLSIIFWYSRLSICHSPHISQL